MKKIKQKLWHDVWVTVRKNMFLNRFLKIMNELTDSKYFIIFVTYL